MKKKYFASNSLARQFRLNYHIISIIPVLLLFILVVHGTLIAHHYLSKLISSSTSELNQDAEKYLSVLGQNIIAGKSKDVARQLEIYFRMHPDRSIQQMRKDPLFLELAYQKVGLTGYTALTEANTNILRVHPNPKLVDRDMEQFAGQMPAWWAITEKASKGEVSSGYYDWIEPDGSVRKKYMVITPVKVPLNGITMLVAATTYIDEFSRPIAAMRGKADSIVRHYRTYITRLWLLFGLIALFVISLSFCGTLILGRRVTSRYILPIVHLADTVRRYGKGQWDAIIHEDIINRNDEMGTLSQAFSDMSKQLKDLFDRLENRLAELKETRDALKHSEAHYRSLFEGVPIGLYRSTPDGRILDANTTFIHMLGYPDRKSFLPHKADELYVNTEDRVKWRAQMEANEDVHAFQTRMKKMDATAIYIENYSHAVLDDNGNVIHYEGALKDITERKLAEEALVQSEARLKKLYETSKQAEEVYRSLIHSSADAIVIYDLNLKATYTSPMFTKLFGWSTEELCEGKIAYVPESEKAATTPVLKDIIETGVPCQGFETMRTTKDGRLIEVSISASRFDDHEGKPAGMLMILRDISEKKRLEAQLQHIERMEAIGTLAGGIAHDFNNLLMAIQGSISLMRVDLEPSHPNYKNLIVIEKQIERGSRLTSQLLGYARKGKYEVRPLNINDVLIESAETLQRTRKDISIHFDLSPKLHPVEADFHQIEQVLMNLFINASDAMTDGGDLYIKTRNVLSEAMRNKAYNPKPGEYIILEIKDTGIGMDRKTMNRIFDPFFTTKDMGRGTGLGLASVYGIVKGHGGYIDVDSEKGQGTTFSIYLPATRQKAKAIPPGKSKAVKGHGTILLVDDESLILEVGANMLKALGYTVLTADSGRKALKVFDAYKEQIDMVILDMIMPDISGSRAFDQIRKINPGIAVLLSSGYSIDGKATEIMNRGCNGFIQKPYTIETLSEKIKEIMEG